VPLEGIHYILHLSGQNERTGKWQSCVVSMNKIKASMHLGMQFKIGG